MAKTADYALGEFTYPRGWFMIGTSADATTTPAAVRYFGQDMVGWRADSGRLTVMDAYTHTVLHQFPRIERHLLCGMAPESFSLLALAPAHRLAPHSSLAHMFDTVRRNSGPKRTRFAARLDEGGGWELEFQEALAFLEESIQQQQPVLILGTALNMLTVRRLI